MRRAPAHSVLPTAYGLLPTAYFLRPTSYFLLLTNRGEQLAVAGRAVLAQHTLAEERDLLLEKSAARVRHVAARRLLDPRIGHCLLLRPKLGGGAAQGCE